MILKFLCENEQLSQLFWHRTELQQAGPSGQPGLLFISSVGDVIITMVTIREKGAGANQELATEQGRCKVMLPGRLQNCPLMIMESLNTALPSSTLRGATRHQRQEEAFCSQQTKAKQTKQISSPARQNKEKIGCVLMRVLQRLQPTEGNN